jgi:predicted RNase H-like HicB family nuclease
LRQRHSGLFAVTLRVRRLPEGKSMQQPFSAIYERDGDWWVVTAVEIPGGFSQGRTIEEACENLLDAVYEMTRDAEPGQVPGAVAGSHRS